MAKSTFFKYLPARLKPLGKPAVWIPLTVVTLAGVFAWEYYNHPEWFNAEPITTLPADSELTSEEAARLSEIDTLDVLLNGSRAPEGTKEVTSQINPDAPERDKAQRDAQSATGNLAGTTPSFDSSFEAYPIPGASTSASSAAIANPAQSSLYSGATSPATGTVQAGATETNRFNFGNGLVNPAAPSTNSALSEAVNRRDAARAAEGSTVPIGNGANSSLLDSEGTVTPTDITNTATGGGPATSPAPGSFIRTTPQMSPPVGTTGYQPPATSNLPTFNVAPTQPTRSPYSAAPQPGQFGNNTPNTPTPNLPTGQVAPAPATVAPSNPVGAGTNPAGTLYTAPTSVQPNQGRAINPRR